MLLLEAKPVADLIRKSVASRVEMYKAAYGRAPKLAVVLVGQDPASVIYTNSKGKAATSVGMEHETIQFPADATPSQVQMALDDLNEDPSVHGILIQRPLPQTFLEEEVLRWVTPEKDVDGFHPENVGKLHLGLDTMIPCTPAGIMELLRYHKIDVSKKTACVIGRSSIVGKPIASLLMMSDATVIQCHSKTRDLKEMCRLADIVVAAAGKPRLIDASYIKPGAVVIDVGIHRDPETKKVFGDVEFDSVAKVASALTPVPGGVGPMTIALLLANTMKAAQRQEPQIEE